MSRAERITADDVRLILKQNRRGCPPEKIAEGIGLHYSTVLRILQYKGLFDEIEKSEKSKRRARIWNKYFCPTIEFIGYVLLGAAVIFEIYIFIVLLTLYAG